jgi:hypothetical protein
LVVDDRAVRDPETAADGGEGQTSQAALQHHVDRGVQDLLATVPVAHGRAL